MAEILSIFEAMFELLNDTVPDHTITVIWIAGLLFASFSSLFSVVNPLAAMPIFLSLTDRFSEKDRIQTEKKASFYMFGVLITFLLIGTYILTFSEFPLRESVLPAA